MDLVVENMYIFPKSLVTPMTAFGNSLELSAPNVYQCDAPTVKPTQYTDFFLFGREKFAFIYHNRHTRAKTRSRPLGPGGYEQMVVQAGNLIQAVFLITLLPWV